MGNTTVSVGFLICDLSIIYIYYLLTICQHIDLLEGAIPYDIIIPSHNIQYSIAKLIIDMINVLFCHTVKTNVYYLYIYIEPTYDTDNMISGVFCFAEDMCI